MAASSTSPGAVRESPVADAPVPLPEPAPSLPSADADSIDRSLHAAAARFTMGLSPAALAEAYSDWAFHLAFSPGKRLQLATKAARKSARFANYVWQCAVDGGEAPVLRQRLDTGFAASDGALPYVIGETSRFAGSLGRELKPFARRKGQVERPVGIGLGKRCGRQAHREARSRG